MTRLPFSLSLVAALTTACPGDDSSETGATASSGPSSGPSTTSSTGSTSTPSTESGSASTSTSTTNESADTAGSGSTTDPGGGPCGESTCSASEYCDWSVDSCGDAEFDEGACAPRPEGCDAVYMPVCGCDGQVYGNECEAQAAGVDIDNNNTCEAMDDAFDQRVARVTLDLVVREDSAAASTQQRVRTSSSR